MRVLIFQKTRISKHFDIQCFSQNNVLWIHT